MGQNLQSLESLAPWRASPLGEPRSSVSLGWGTAQCPQAPPNPPDPRSVPTHPLTRHGGRRAQVEACSSRRAGYIQCPGSEAVLPCLSGSRGTGVCPSTSRNGSWWEKSQHSLSATGGGWEEGEEGYECLTQIKQPKKNKGRKQPEAMASIFFQVNFPPPPLPLSPPGGGKIGACGGEWLHGEIFPCLCHVSPLPVTPLCRLRGAAPTVPLFSPGIPSATRRSRGTPLSWQGLPHEAPCPSSQGQGWCPELGTAPRVSQSTLAPRFLSSPVALRCSWLSR